MSVLGNILEQWLICTASHLQNLGDVARIVNCAPSQDERGQAVAAPLKGHHFADGVAIPVVGLACTQIAYMLSAFLGQD